ncbi:MAG: 50S ribosomal protein L18 [Clostridia bacterium]
MINKNDKNTLRNKRHFRVRKKVEGTPERPRLNVYRSLNEVYAQIIDDTKGTTLVSANSRDKKIVKLSEGKNKTEIAGLVGQEIAKKALKAKIKLVVFDRGGYLYTGRVKSLADKARENGLEF